MIKVKDEKDKFEVTLDVSQYKPEELKVSTVNNVLSIEGKHEEEVRFTKINLLSIKLYVHWLGECQLKVLAVNKILQDRS